MGLSTFRSQVSNFNIFKKISHNVNNFIPFGREFFIVTDFLSNKSALQFSHKLILDDIKYVMMKAKFSDISRSNNSFNKKKMLFQRIIVGFVVGIMSCFFLFGPLLPYAISDGNLKVHKVDRATLKIFLEGPSGVWFGDLFYTTLNYKVTNNTLSDNVFKQYFNEKDSISNSLFQ